MTILYGIFTYVIEHTELSKLTKREQVNTSIV